jgi:bacterioferritin (cytochrome b1)
MNPSDDYDIRESFNDQIKQHEDNIDFLNSQSNRLTDTVLDLQGN